MFYGVVTVVDEPGGHLDPTLLKVGEMRRVFLHYQYNVPTVFLVEMVS